MFPSRKNLQAKALRPLPPLADRPMGHLKRSIWLGYDPREDAAFAVARESCRFYLNTPVPINGLLLQDLIDLGVYQRPMEYRAFTDHSLAGGSHPVMWDVVSDAPMSTQHANARFFVPMLAGTGWAMFTDGDVMFRSDVSRLFEQLDRSKAVYCVHHQHAPSSTFKMDGQVQTAYGRKNWSSVMIFNCDHPSNRCLTLDVLNNTPGRDLHAFCWLMDDEIGELEQSWNFLVGHSDPEIYPDIVHFTEGVPNMPGYEGVMYADEWRTWRNRWVRGSLRPELSQLKI